MQHSEDLKELAAAISKAQSEIGEAHKNKNNPAFRSSYADLGEVWDTIQPLLDKHGLSLMFFPAMTQGKAHTMTYMLLHTSGQYIKEEYTCPIAKDDPQGVGSAISYGRRYVSSAVFGVCTTDDDGNAASKAQPARQQASIPKTTVLGSMATEVQVDYLNKYLTKHELNGVSKQVDGETWHFIKQVHGSLTESRCKSMLRAAQALVEPEKVKVAA